MNAASTHPAFSPQFVQSPARVRLSYVSSSGEMRYLILPGSVRTYRSEGFTFATQNWESKELSSRRPAAWRESSPFGPINSSQRKEPERGTAALGHRYLTCSFRKRMAFFRT